MGLLGKIWVKLGLDNSELDKGFKDSEKSASGFQNSLKKIGGMMATAFSVTAVINFAKASVKAYNESALAAAKLESVLRSTGGAAGLTSGQMQTYAKELQSITMFEDDATINAMALMATFKSVKGDIFKQAIASAQDLSTVLGSDLNGAVLQLGKALESPEIGMTMLRRSGISFTTEQIEAVKKLVAEGNKYEAQLIILKEVQSQFGGAAKAAAETAAGSWAKMKNAFGDLMETIGSGTEKTKGFANSLKVWFEQLNKVITSDSLSFWQKLTAVLGGNVNAFRKANEEFAKNTEYQKQLEANADAVVSSIKSVADAEHMLASMDKKNQTELSKLIEYKLNGYIRSKTVIVKTEEEIAEAAKLAAEAAKKAKDEKIAGLKEEISILKTLYGVQTDEIDRAFTYEAIAAKSIQLEQLQKEGELIANGIIPQKEREIELLKELQGYISKDQPELIKNLGEQISAREKELSLLKQTNAELLRKKNIELPAVKKPSTIGSYGLTTTGTGVTEGFAAGWKKGQVPSAEELKKWNNDFDEEVARSANIAANFGRTVASSISDSMRVIMDAIASGEKIDASDMTKAILMPFADMATQIGEVMVATGAAALAAKAIGSAGGPWGAIAAGAALIALGTAASAAIGSIGSGFGGKQESDPYSYNGGATPTVAAVNSGPVEIFGVLKGQDIYLSSQKYQQNKAR